MSGLNLNRKVNEVIEILDELTGSAIAVKVVKLGPSRVELKIVAPERFRILRSELPPKSPPGPRKGSA